MIANDRSEHCSEPPSRVNAYNTDRVLLVEEQLNGNEILDFMPDKKEPAEEVFLADTSLTSRQDSSQVEPLQANPAIYGRGTNVHRLPEQRVAPSWFDD